MPRVSSKSVVARRYGTFSARGDDKAASLFDSVFSKKPSNSQFQTTSSFKSEMRIFTQTVDLPRSHTEDLPLNPETLSSNNAAVSCSSICASGVGIENSDLSEDEDELIQGSSQSSTTSLDASLSLVRVDSQYAKTSAFDQDDNLHPGTSKMSETNGCGKQSLKSRAIGRSSKCAFSLEDQEMVPEVKRQRSDEAGFLENEDKDSQVVNERSSCLAPREGKAKYKHRWADDEEDEVVGEKQVPNSVGNGPHNRASSVQRGEKIHKVKDPNVCHESGKIADYKQDMSYVLSTLLDKNASVNLKCLSLISLAKKCSSSDFRKFLRADGLLEKTLKAVNDSSLPSISICISVIIYIMARDKACIKYDDALLRMLSVFLKMENPERSADYLKYAKLAWEALKMWYNESSSLLEGTMQFDFTEETLAPSALILEAFVYICSCNREDDILKNEMLGLGVLQFLVLKVDKISLRLLHEKLTDDSLLLRLRYLERCFRIIETCTFCNKKNQAYLISHRGGLLLQTCGRLMTFCHQRIEKNEDDGSEILENSFNCAKRIAGVLINLSHDNELCSTKLGNMNSFLALCLSFFTYLTPRFATEDRRFDTLVLVSSLLVNLVERCNANRKKLINARVKIYNSETKCAESVVALKALAQMFVHHDSAARTVDEELDNDLILEGVSDEEGEASDNEGVSRDGRLKRPIQIELTEDEMAETVQKAMNKASAHMEGSVIASYIALIIGCLMQQNEESISVVKAEMPEGNLSGLISQLQRFLEFMKYMRMRGSSHRSVEHIIELLEELNK